ncbi:MAG: hypothetical protein WKH64_10020 [Chloroflexia bacterium]
MEDWDDERPDFAPLRPDRDSSGRRSEPESNVPGAGAALAARARVLLAHGPISADELARKLYNVSGPIAPWLPMLDRLLLDVEGWNASRTVCGGRRTPSLVSPSCCLCNRERPQQPTAPARRSPSGDASARLALGFLVRRWAFARPDWTRRLWFRFRAGGVRAGCCGDSRLARRSTARRDGRQVSGGAQPGAVVVFATPLERAVRGGRRSAVARGLGEALA